MYATPTKAAPSGPVLWIATYDRGRRPRVFEAQTWVAAREQAMKSFGCGPDEIQVEAA